MDRVFQYDQKALSALRSSPQLAKNPRHFSHINISLMAAMKMLKHALKGVEKGRQKGSNPVEIMGLLVGKAEGKELFVFDVCPIPVEGSETRVIADEADLYLLEMMESLEKRRNEGFLGWYHSHPFDLTSFSHCFLSSVDVETQSTWQSTSPFWTALVVDPLRSLALKRPEIGAFRVFPSASSSSSSPSFFSSPFECPDGSLEPNQQKKITRWGMAHSRYYSLTISYFSSSLSFNCLESLTNKSFWAKILSSSSLEEKEYKETLEERIRRITDDLPPPEVALSKGKKVKRGHFGALEDSLDKAAQQSAQVAVDHWKGECCEFSKSFLFNFQRKLEEKRVSQVQKEAESMKLDEKEAKEDTEMS